MGSRPEYRFESAPDLPGSDRIARPLLWVINRSLNALWNLDVVGDEHVPLDGPAILCPNHLSFCLLYTSPSPRDVEESRMPSSA